MLYNPSWDKLSLAALVAWLEKQPRDRQYCYGDYGGCLAAQYNQSIGRRYNVTLVGHRTKNKSFDHQLEWIAGGWKENEYDVGERTFGAALERAKAMLAQ